MAGRTMEQELEALRRELSPVPVMEDDGGGPASVDDVYVDNDMRSEIERVVRELQTHLTDAVDDAEQAVSDHPVAAVAAAFLLGIAVGGLLMRIGTR
ncbi:hypothetical protein [Pseudorhodoplanes sinuspersici]|uniref:Uncharacterized protein n=1 Tax=Pseudorhodoplanes sinuspersici TaxID=1235591 RepID=A0A1W6ZSH4_9HYPH|nr:hypothetical protein [Pseudorhodoplanes sinuspersici]ARQ00051.1 hypothetical protein CAK95_13880 [Pseudorhodoplanes sinuspersici]RKE71088.1 hypothetical protein DFP91_3344 [Pseudorhodoplanes sinuspersici]